MRMKRILCLGMAAAVICTSLPTTALAQEVQTEMTEEASNSGDFQIEDGVLKRYQGPGGKVTIPEGVTSIGYSAFYACSGLTEVTIPEGVTSIGEFAFELCSGLAEITIPKSVTSIGRGVFSTCNELTSIIVEEGNPTYDSRGGCNAVIETKSNTLIAGCNNTVIPENVRSIGNNAFSSCNNGLTEVTIPKSVTSIGENAFSGCSYLTEVTIPKSVTSIGRGAFFGCRSLKSVTIPEGVTSIGEFAFGYIMSNLKIPDFIVYGTSGSEAERYAKDNGFIFRLSSESNSSDKITCKKTVYNVAYGAKPFKIDAASKDKMIFTSSKPGVAAVDKKTGRVMVKSTGTAVITIKAGKAVKKVTIKVSPGKPSVMSAKTEKGKKLVVKWAKDKMASGYLIQISTDKNFKKDVKSKNLSKTSYTFTKLKTGKAYYVRIRSYRKAGKETLYSVWSKAKLSGKVKK